ncbi:hypothetical protein BpHYR1_001410 [Brachionus plicatilis]|uniref:Uncharacterized protein n=1 Tax=Brachionus plicatilis TaxID=10195 RepID=A0A3M7RW39_BRAPC|nr:hypothetical protein BpHYR1_001410 [Brachionus plicatilis]
MANDICRQDQSFHSLNKCFSNYYRKIDNQNIIIIQKITLNLIIINFTIQKIKFLYISFSLFPKNVLIQMIHLYKII